MELPFSSITLLSRPERFSGDSGNVFQYAAAERKAAASLLTLRQGRRRVSDYVIEFRICAAETEDRLGRRREGRCFYCGCLGHLIARCPIRPKHPDIRIFTPNVFVYLDDIRIFSSNLNSHIQQVRVVLRRLLQHQLFVNLDKCEFHRASMSFLGFILAEGEMRMDPGKVDVVLRWPTPASRKDIQRTCQVTFNRLKASFTAAPILIVPDPDRQFMVEVDSSNLGIGAILSQRSPKDGRIHPCVFLSRKLTLVERNYDVGDRELLAVKTALAEWRHWLEGSQVPFVVFTDHKNLEYQKTANQVGRVCPQFSALHRYGSTPRRAWLSSVSVSSTGRRLCGPVSPGRGTTLQTNLGSSSEDTATHEQCLQIRSEPQEKGRTSTQGGTASMALHQRSPAADGIPQTCSQVDEGAPYVPRQQTSPESRFAAGSSGQDPHAPPPPACWTVGRCILCAGCCLPPAGEGGSSTWWTGRDMDRRSAPGSPHVSSWTAPSSGTFTQPILMLLGR
ncbi:uncharacterized protein LOC133512493 [Syngnathoides biaculeatus]|uniref:uncharacterized protein LOC133512493 n=1 Tax=Syngnathoides biaculeatus TaxID=300417 RepID=UPI002ADE13A5|nr:uncharacterized protein LOC133512493 [Syngnathoides biaculeatus]